MSDQRIQARESVVFQPATIFDGEPVPAAYELALYGVIRVAESAVDGDLPLRKVIAMEFDGHIADLRAARDDMIAGMIAGIAAHRSAE